MYTVFSVYFVYSVFGVFTILRKEYIWYNIKLVYNNARKIYLTNTNEI